MSTRWTPEQYEDYCRKHPQDSNHAPQASRQVSNPEPQCDKAPALDGADAREGDGFPRVVVRFTGYRVRPLDPDNFSGGVKDLLDGLRHAGIIPGDEPWRIRLVTDQVKVRHFHEEETVVEVIFPTNQQL